MDNQHKKIKGYRGLTKVEIDLMNKIKVKSEEVKQLIEEAETSLYKQTEPAINQDGLDDVQRNLELARDNLQTGFMWFIRAVARPQSF